MRIMRFVVPIAIAGAILTSCKVATPTAPATTAPVDNGVKDLTADEIIAKAKAAAKEAGSFRVKGDMTTDGQKLTVDIKSRNSDIFGTVKTSMGTVTVLGVSSQIYLQADEAFWTAFAGSQGAALATLFKGKWVKVGTDTAGLSEFIDIANIDGLVTPKGSATKGPVSIVNGQGVITLVDSKDQGKLYIATMGKPLPVRIEGPPGQGAVDFTEWGAKFDDIKAPAADQVVDLSALLPK